jgi:hypothetical protein
MTVISVPKPDLRSGTFTIADQAQKNAAPSAKETLKMDQSFTAPTYG